MKKKLFVAPCTVLASAVPGSWGERKVTICHFPPRNRANVQIITIGESAVRTTFVIMLAIGLYSASATPVALPSHSTRRPNLKDQDTSWRLALN